MSRQITVYSTPFCVPCDRLKAYLRHQGVDFQVKDLLVEEDAADRFEAMNIRSAPILEVDGEILFGPDLNLDNVDRVLGL
jgi:glutaredoxin